MKLRTAVIKGVEIRDFDNRPLNTEWPLKRG